MALLMWRAIVLVTCLRGQILDLIHPAGKNDSRATLGTHQRENASVFQLPSRWGSIFFVNSNCCGGDECFDQAMSSLFHDFEIKPNYFY